MCKLKLTLAILAAFAFSTVNVMAVSPAVHNDFWQQANPINPIPFTGSQDTFYATVGVNANNAKDEPATSCVSSGHTVWYKFTASKNATLTIDTIGSGYDTVLGVYTRAGGNNFTEIGCNDDIDFTLASRVTLTVNRGKTYYLQIGAFASNDAGNLVLNVN